jgi:hypothetical protein
VLRLLDSDPWLAITLDRVYLPLLPPTEQSSLGSLLDVGHTTD